MEYKHHVRLSVIVSEFNFPIRMIKKLYPTLLLGSLATISNAAVIFDDAIDGNASSDGSAPTSLTFALGSNEVLGTVSADASINNTRNFYTFSISEGQFLQSITLNEISVTNTGEDPNDPGFYALVSGTTSATPGTGFANLGGALYDPSDLDSDLLGQITGGGISGGSGFTTIGEGDFTFVIQQTGTEISSFTLDFQVVPEPSSTALLGLAAIGLISRRRRS